MRFPRRAGSRTAGASQLVLLALVAGVALAACGEGSQPRAEPLGETVAGSVAPLAQCRDWKSGTEPEKLATIADIRSQINLEGGTVQTPPLSDEEAMRVFDNACSHRFARGFRLYVLYARAAGFAPLMRER
jgi:hypothetical protein